jgi:hypothetical protein
MGEGEGESEGQEMLAEKLSGPVTEGGWINTKTPQPQKSAPVKPHLTVFTWKVPRCVNKSHKHIHTHTYANLGVCICVRIYLHPHSSSKPNEYKL